MLCLAHRRKKGCTPQVFVLERRCDGGSLSDPWGQMEPRPVMVTIGTFMTEHQTSTIHCKHEQGKADRPWTDAQAPLLDIRNPSPYGPVPCALLRR